MVSPAEFWIRQLQLSPHPEGGYYREVYRASTKVRRIRTPDWTIDAERPAATSIYFLLKTGEFSAFHRIDADEIWHFYAGDPVILFELLPGGSMREHRLGSNPNEGEEFQVVIGAGNWFAARLQPEGDFGLVGCGVAPGFEFSQLEMASREKLLRDYPQHASLILGLTR